jgi:hypothetical protein
MIAESLRSPQSSLISRMICRDVFGSSDAVGSSTKSKVGVLNQRAADADSLALTAGQFVGALVGHVIETDPGQELECLVHIALWKFPHETLPKTDITKSAAQHIFLDGEPFDQGVFLENHSHPPACAA